MGRDDQAPLFLAPLEVGEGPDLIGRLFRVDDQDVPAFDGGLHSRDQQDSARPCEIPELLRVGDALVIGEGEDLEAFPASAVDQPFGTVGNGIEGVFAAVQVKIRLQARRLGLSRLKWETCPIIGRGGRGSYFPPPCFTQA